MTGRRALVAGGGITGLSAALTLVDAGWEVTLVEASDRLGGKLRTTPFAGRLVDEGADAFLLRVPWALDLCRRLGIEDELVHPAERSAYVWSRGDLRRLPPQLLGVPTDLEALAASGILSDEGVARVAEDLTRPGSPPNDDEPIGAVIERRIGPEALDRLVDPLVGGINAGDSRRLSLAATVPQLDAAARDPDHPSLVEACRAQQRRAAGAAEAPVFASPRDGMGRLVDALVATMSTVDLVLGTSVEVVEPARSGWLVDGREVDGLVLALPASVAAALVPPAAAEAKRHLAAIEHASVALVTLAVAADDVGRPLDASGFLVPRVEGLAVTACSWASSKWAHLAAADGTVLLRSSVGRHGDDRALDLDDGKLVERVVDDLGRTMALRGAPSEARVSRWPGSFPQYAPGHLDRVDAIEADLAAHAPGIVVAGAALRGVGVPACIRQGGAAASALISANVLR